MAKKREGKPEDFVRLVVRLPQEERGRLKAYAARVGEDMEDVARRWLMERVSIEERKLR